MTDILKVWNEIYETMVYDEIKREAHNFFRIHQLPTSLEEWENKQKDLRKKIWISLGAKPDHALKLDLQVLKVIQMDGYQIQCIIYQSQKEVYVTGNLYIPEGAGPFPGVINVHGHYSEGKLAEGVQARGHSLAQEGYVCLCVDAFGSGERSTIHGEFEYHGGNLGASLLDVGKTLMGMQIVDNMRGVDLLSSLDCVDSNKIGVTGASGGGNQTMWLAAMDERIKAAVPVVSVGTFESYVGSTNCICEVLPDGLTFTEESGVLALCAPRALKICNALQDRNKAFHSTEMLRSYDSARKIYGLYNSENSICAQVFNCSHGYKPEIREAMLGWFDRWLKNKGDGSSKAEKSFRILSGKELMCFQKGKRPLKVSTIAEFSRCSAEELHQKTLSRVSLDTNKKRNELKQILRINNRLKIKEIHEHGTIFFDERKWIRVSIETTGGSLFPLLITKPLNKEKRYVIGMQLDFIEGKAAFLNTSLYKSLRKSGSGILVFDFWGTGEIRWLEKKIDINHDLSRSCLWLGKTLIGEWVKNALLMKDFLSQFDEAISYSLAGVGEAGLIALFCSALEKSVKNVFLESSPMSYRFSDHPTKMSMGIHVPGIIPWGDISMAAALTEARLTIKNPLKIDASPYNENELKALEKEIIMLKKKCSIPVKPLNLEFIS